MRGGGVRAPGRDTPPQARPGPAAATHLTGLQDGDHVALVEGQLSRLGARVLTLGDALGAWGPAPLRPGGREGEGQRGMKGRPREREKRKLGKRQQGRHRTEIKREQPGQKYQAQTQGPKAEGQEEKVTEM